MQDDRNNQRSTIMAATIVTALSIFLCHADRANAADYIRENYGSRNAPAAGFLVLAPMPLLAGFKETKHFYTQAEYDVDMQKDGPNGVVEFSILESSTASIFMPKTKPFKTFSHEGFTGYVFSNCVDCSDFDLYWLGGGKHRIIMSIEEKSGKHYSADDLIQILESMKESAGEGSVLSPY